MSTHLSQSEGRTQPAATNPHQSSPEALDTLCIRVQEDSPDAGVFVVQIQSRDPLLLGFWQRKAFFYNGQVQQTDTRLREDGEGLAFVLHALHRSQRLSNSHYWTPFVVGLCLDALLFRYRLPANLHWNGDIQQVMEENALVLIR